MPHIGILGTALTTHITKPKGLFVGSQDVIKGTTSAPTWGTPIETVEVTENGPGGVSSMHFRVDDPGLTIAVTPGMDVLFYDFTLSYPIFRGWVQGVGISPAFGEQGRFFDVECIGIECMFDWGILASDLTLAVGTLDVPGLQAIVAASTGLGPVRHFSSNTTTNGSQAFPVTPAGFMSGGLAEALTITAGTSVREALRTFIGARTPFYATSTLVNVAFTIDMYYGLRVFRTEQVGFEVPDDYTAVTLSNTGASTTTTEALEYATDLGTAHSVWIKGANAAGTGLVSDGSGLPGQVAYIEDTTVDTAAKLTARGTSYLQDFASGLRGQFSVTDEGGLKVTANTTHTGGMVILTDARVGLSSTRLRIMSIAKSYNPSGREDWQISFGGIAPSMANLVRRLTRTIRS